MKEKTNLRKLPWSWRRYSVDSPRRRKLQSSLLWIILSQTTTWLRTWNSETRMRTLYKHVSNLYILLQHKQRRPSNSKSTGAWDLIGERRNKNCNTCKKIKSKIGFISWGQEITVRLAPSIKWENEESSTYSDNISFILKLVTEGSPLMAKLAACEAQP